MPLFFVHSLFSVLCSKYFNFEFVGRNVPLVKVMRLASGILLGIWSFWVVKRAFQIK